MVVVVVAAVLVVVVVGNIFTSMGSILTCRDLFWCASASFVLPLFAVLCIRVVLWSDGAVLWGGAPVSWRVRELKALRSFETGILPLATSLDNPCRRPAPDHVSSGLRSSKSASLESFYYRRYSLPMQCIRRILSPVEQE